MPSQFGRSTAAIAPELQVILVLHQFFTARSHNTQIIH